MIPYSKRNWKTIFIIIFPAFLCSHNEGCSKPLYRGFWARWNANWLSQSPFTFPVKSMSDPCSGSLPVPLLISSTFRIPIRSSAGVKQQYCGCLGKTENCQSGVFLACAGDKGYGLVDYEPYISAGRRGKGPDPCRAEIPALFFRPCGREPQLCEARGGNMALSEEIRRWWNNIFRQ